MMEADDEADPDAVRPRASPTTPRPAATTPRSSSTSSRRRPWGSRSTPSAGARCRRCRAASRSGSCSSCCCAAPPSILLLDEPDNYLDVPGKTWLEQQLRETPKTVLLISHDRELLNQCASHVVSVELGAAGNTAWVHGGGFASFHEARADRFSRLEELRRRWDEEHVEAQGARAVAEGQGGVQRRHGLALPGGADAPAQVRGGRPADRRPAGAERPHAAHAAVAPPSGPSSASGSSSPG